MYKLTRKQHVIVTLLLEQMWGHKPRRILKDILIANYYDVDDRILLNELRETHYSILLQKYPLILKELGIKDYNRIPTMPKGNLNVVMGKPNKSFRTVKGVVKGINTFAIPKQYSKGFTII